MNPKLWLAIERAENEFREVTDFEKAIVSLSTHKTATLVLSMALRDAVTNYENFWSAIEQMPEFKENYSDRDQARHDFLLTKGN